MDSGIRDIFAYGIWNPSNVWNPGSKFHGQRLQYLESGIRCVESRIQDCLVFIYIGQVFKKLFTLNVFKKIKISFELTKIFSSLMPSVVYKNQQRNQQNQHYSDNGQQDDEPSSLVYRICYRLDT